MKTYKMYSNDGGTLRFGNLTELRAHFIAYLDHFTSIGWSVKRIPQLPLDTALVQHPTGSYAFVVGITESEI